MNISFILERIDLLVKTSITTDTINVLKDNKVLVIINYGILLLMLMLTNYQNIMIQLQSLFKKKTIKIVLYTTYF